MAIRIKPRQLAIKLFILVAAVLLVGELIHTFVSSRVHQKHMMSRMILNTNRSTEVIRRSIYYGMLENDKESIQRTIAIIGQSQGVRVVRIYNKQGAIIVSSSGIEMGAKVDMKAEACDGCHVAGKPLPVQSEATYSRIYRDPKGVRQLGIISPIKNEPSCTNAPCHAHPAENTVLGVLDVQMSMAAMDASIVEEQKQLVVISLITIFAAAGLAGFFLWTMVHKPVRRLMEGTKEATRGNLTHRIQLPRQDELGQLATSFNSMLASLESAQNKLKEWADTLEDQVAVKTGDLEQIQRQMLQIEKITSLGRLSTTVAHELNNPLASILNYAKLLLREMDGQDIPPAVRESMEKDLRFIRDESRRCGEIVKNMLLFAGRSGGTFETIRLREVIEKSLMLLAHRMEMENIEMDLKMDEGNDTITGDPAQLQQAFVALLLNALEAMPDGGVLSLEFLGPPESPTVQCRITDTGVGIPLDELDQVFEPFFSTKTGGKSMGLGLSVVYGIIHRHHGTIDVNVGEHQGTTITISLPREQTIAKEAEESAAYTLT